MTIGDWMPPVEEPCWVHKFGEVIINMDAVAEQLDDDQINTGGRYTEMTFEEAGKRDMIAKGWKEREWRHWQCTACGEIKEIEPNVLSGDESISACPECGTMESYKFHSMTVWDKPKKEEKDNG